MYEVAYDLVELHVNDAWRILRLLANRLIPDLAAS